MGIGYSIVPEETLIKLKFVFAFLCFPVLLMLLITLLSSRLKLMVRVAIIGCGLLGVKIAGEFAYHGHRVKCYDNNLQSLNSVYARYQSDKAQLYSEQLIESPNFTGQVLCLSRLEETVNDAQIVIECVIEDFDVKCLLLEKVSQICPVECIIVSGTLRLDIAKLAESVKNMERFLGLRFLYPVYYISEVEITPHKETANWAIERLRALLSQMGKTLFFRSGQDPLILSEEKRELRKYQRADEIRNCGFSPTANTQTEGYLPDLSRHNHSLDSHRLFGGRQQPSLEFSSFSNEKSNVSKNNYEMAFFKMKNNRNNDDIIEYMNQDQLDCAICMDKPKNSVLRPCNHMVTCVSCSNSLLNRQDNCPVCRIKITEVIKIFMS